MTRDYDALVLDIDGTLLNEQEQIPAPTRHAIAEARERGVIVMLATGRSHLGTREIAAQLELEAPSLVFNGAALFCRLADRLIETNTLPSALAEDLLSFAERRDLLPMVGRHDAQYVREPRSHEVALLASYRIEHRLPLSALPREQAVRITLLSTLHAHSAELHAEVLTVVRERPAYLTHFGLSALAGFRDSAVQVVDIQAECRGKAEALRVLEQRFGIPASRVVAVGDADNDLPLVSRAGLGVAMDNATQNLKRAAGRVIGHNDSNALAELIGELFLD